MQPKILIITAPSGAGKTSITRHLMQRFPQLAFSVSAATRTPRVHEKDGVDYYFMQVDDFKQKIEEGAFLEWEMVYEGKYYGTLKSELDRIWLHQQVPVLDIDVQGALHVKAQYPQQTLTLFIEPPSLEILEQRLRARGTETPESIADRMNKAGYELSFKTRFDRIIINQNLEDACEAAGAVVGAWLKEEHV
ncbi:MAG: guanylate kinase [Bacteroidetes bacterium]|nr:guanylate kinase [Bacteroidota bacterium]